MRLTAALLGLIAPLAVLAGPAHQAHQHLHVRATTQSSSTTANSTVTATGTTKTTSCASCTVSPILGTAQLPATLSQEIFHPFVTALPLTPASIFTAIGNLLQSLTNGQSVLGTSDAPTYPKYLNNNGLLPLNPFGIFQPVGRSPPPTMPYFGTTRTYNFVLSRSTLAPDGVSKPVILVNGAYPGPAIQANWGDTIKVTVTNNIQASGNDTAEGTSLHWHGLVQKGTPYYDGVPGLEQCPIAPGQSLTYTFLADQYGTSWWHSHFSAQYTAGAFGPMIIYGPTTAAYDIDLGPVMLNDYYHRDYYSILEDVVGTNLAKIRPVSDNNLINGKNSYNCSLAPAGTACTPNAGYSKFYFQTGKTHRLRLVNSGSEAVQKFSIDNHILTVIAVDFVPIVPYNTTIVTLGIGQRTDILVTAKLPSNSTVWMRSSLTCSLDTQPNALAMVYYDSANKTAVPTSTAYVDNTNPCANDPLTSMVPYFAETPTTTPAVTTEIDVGIEVNATGNFLWTMNKSSFRIDYNDPVLFLAAQGNDSYPYDPQWNVYNFGTNTSIRLYVVNQSPAAHPMHLHGHNFYLLNEGLGTWDGKTIVNPSNPTRRDVHILQVGGYMVIQFNADNPGVWPFHCHIAWHVSSGLYVSVLERPDLIPSQIKIPSAVQNTCASWMAFTNQGTIDQIDSGV